MSSKIQTVIFDLGGVLIDWNPEYVFREIFKDEAEMRHFFQEVCTPERSRPKIFLPAPDNPTCCADRLAATDAPVSQHFALQAVPAQAGGLALRYRNLRRVWRCPVSAWQLKPGGRCGMRPRQCAGVSRQGRARNCRKIQCWPRAWQRTLRPDAVPRARCHHRPRQSAKLAQAYR